MPLAQLDAALEERAIERSQLAQLIAVAAVTILVAIAIAVAGSNQAGGTQSSGNPTPQIQATTNPAPGDLLRSPTVALGEESSPFAALAERRQTSPAEAQAWGQTILVALASVGALTGFALVVQRSRRSSTL